MTNFSDRMVEMGGDEPMKALPVLKEALKEANSDLSALVNKWLDDLPILLAVINNTVPQLERIVGKDGVIAARELQKVTVCVAMVLDQ